MSGSQQLLLGGSQAAAVDPFFYSVTSLLHGDGTNGAQNNTFLDSSTNNFTITRNGNTTQGSFSPFSQTGWGNYFDGTGDYLSLANPNTNIGSISGDFTIECWINWITAPPGNSSGNERQIIGQHAWPESSSGNWWVILGINVGLYAYFAGGGSYDLISSSSFTWNVGVWYHVAIVRSGSTVTIYLNGVSVGSGTSTKTLCADNVRPLTIGADNDGSHNASNAYISNMRLVKGTAVYTANFTVPTTPLTAIANTSLLTCQANRFLDASSNAFAITRNGDVSVQPFSPFNPTTAYSTSAVGGSGYFDGSGDYLTVANNTALQMGSGDFTIEYWWYPTSIASYRNPIDKGYTGSGALLLQTGNGDGRIIVYASGSAVITASTAVAVNAWNHMALVRSGTSLVLYLNGASVGSATNSTNFNNTAALGIGATATAPSGGGVGSFPIVGYLNDVRFVKGTAVYTAAFTPPTAPLTAITNTSLLTNFTNAGIFDNAADADYETVGNAQISTSVKKYGTGSMSFDGTGDYLVSADSEAWSFGAGDFTAEAWIYPASFANEPMIMGQWSGDLGGTGLSWALMFSSGSTGYLRLITSSNGSSVLFDLSSSPYALSLNTWYHIAAVRIGTTFKLFVNGNQVATTTNSSALYNATNALTIGSESNTTTQYFNGYVDDLRISKGVARYPYNFTPPTAEFPNIGGTVTLTADPYFDYTTLLLPGNGTNGAQNNTFLDSSTNNFTITRNGNTTQGTFSPFSQTGWGNYFDGTGDYLTAPSGASPSGTGTFTVEFWIYPLPIASGYRVIFANGTGGGFAVLIQSAGTISYGRALVAVDGTTTGAVSFNQWNHVALVRSGTGSNQFVVYINGTSAGTFTNSTNYSAGTAYIGIDGNGIDFPVNAYLSNVRVTNTAVYTSNFTPSTTPLTAISGTSLLTCQSNRFVDNSSNAFAITRNGDVSVQAFSPFNPTAAWSAATYGGSGYFDGSGDYLSLADNAAFAMGTGNFTAEFWLYTADQSNNYPGILSASTYTDTGAISIRYDNTGNANKIFIYLAGASPSDPAVTSSAYAFGQWIHVAVIRDSSTALKIYVNGVLDGTATISAGQNVDFSGANSFYIGRGFDVDGGAAYYAGYITNVRLVKGQALASGNFTPPTAPVTASSVGWTGANAAGSITGTMSLLMSATNAGIYDATSKNDLETVGNAQISTTQSKFGGSSMYFDGTGDWLIGRTTDLASFGTGDFTIEGWLYPSAVTGADRCLWDTRASSGDAGMVVFIDTNGKISTFTSNAIRLTSTNALSANTWQHFALCRYNGTMAVYINGIQNGTLAYSTTITCPGRISVAVRFDDLAPYTGYIDDLRITKGIARYTSNFTPPTTAFLTL